MNWMCSRLPARVQGHFHRTANNMAACFFAQILVIALALLCVRYTDGTNAYVATDSHGNLLVTAGAGRNISTSADALQLNGRDVALADWVTNLVGAFQMQLDQLQRELNITRTQLQTAREQLEILQPVIQEQCRGTGVSSTPFQTFETYSAQDWEYFTMDGVSYLAVANFENASTTSIQSYIYRFNTTLSQFVIFQRINTTGAIDWEYFSINGTSFLVVANANTGNSRNASSEVFTFDPATDRFVSFQQIATMNAHDWEAFSINSTTYLVVANNANTDRNGMLVTDTLSAIYQFNATAAPGGRFVLFQLINTNGARNWEALTIGHDHFLVVANSNSGTSVIYRFDSVTRQFHPFQTITHFQAKNFKFLLINGAQYLAGVNMYGPSYVYTYNHANSTGAKFVLFQQIPFTNGLEWFTANGATYLITYNSSTVSFFRFDQQASASGAFVVFQEVPIDAYGYKFTYFSMNNIHFIAFANNPTSSIYTFSGQNGSPVCDVNNPL